MRKSRMRLVAGMFCAVVLAALAPLGHADDESFTVLVRFYPAPGREAELQVRLSKLRDFVHKHNPGVTYRLHRSEKAPAVFLMYETFPSQTAFDDMATKVFPAFQKEHGPIPEGITARPVEREVFRVVTD
jgi:quinol monooxygenase YgiN